MNILFNVRTNLTLSIIIYLTDSPTVKCGRHCFHFPDIGTFARTPMLPSERFPETEGLSFPSLKLRIDSAHITVPCITQLKGPLHHRSTHNSTQGLTPLWLQGFRTSTFLLYYTDLTFIFLWTNLTQPRPWDPLLSTGFRKQITLTSILNQNRTIFRKK